MPTASGKMRGALSSWPNRTCAPAKPHAPRIGIACCADGAAAPGAPYNTVPSRNGVDGRDLVFREGLGRALTRGIRRPLRAPIINVSCQAFGARWN